MGRTFGRRLGKSALRQSLYLRKEGWVAPEDEKSVWDLEAFASRLRERSALISAT